MAVQPLKNTNYMVIIHSTNVDSSRKSVTITAPLPESFGFGMSNSYEAPFAQGLIQDQTLKTAASAFGIRAAVPALTAQLWQGTSETDMTVELELHTENDPLADIRQPILDLLSLTTPSVDPATNMMKSPGPSLEDSIASVANLASDSLTSLATTASNFFEKLLGAPPLKFVQNAVSNPATTTLAGNGVTQPTANATPPGLGSTEFWKRRVKNQVSIQIGNYAFYDSVVIPDVRLTFMSSIDPTTGWPHHVKLSVVFKPLFTIVASDLPNIFVTKPASSTGGGLTSLLPDFLKF